MEINRLVVQRNPIHIFSRKMIAQSIPPDLSRNYPTTMQKLSAATAKLIACANTLNSI